MMFIQTGFLAMNEDFLIFEIVEMADNYIEIKK